MIMWTIGDWILLGMLAVTLASHMLRVMGYA